MKDVPHFYAKDRTAWRTWLEEHHDTETAVWLVHDKGKNRTFKWEDIVQEALCFGWIDSTAGKVSDTQSKIYVSRRKPKSVWSKINKAHVERLIASGEMTLTGLKVIEVAKGNGSWDALNRSDALELPEELVALLMADATAQQHFQSFSDSAKKQILSWVYSAKRDETKSSRIQKTVEMARRGLRANYDQE
ncbi:MAG: YdeI/OmpD-associated family protein [Candidatus Saccharimonadales bacterium]